MHSREKIIIFTNFKTDTVKNENPKKQKQNDKNKTPVLASRAIICLPWKALTLLGTMHDQQMGSKCCFVLKPVWVQKLTTCDSWTTRGLISAGGVNVNGLNDCVQVWWAKWCQWISWWTRPSKLLKRLQATLKLSAPCAKKLSMQVSTWGKLWWCYSWYTGLPVLNVKLLCAVF